MSDYQAITAEEQLQLEAETSLLGILLQHEDLVLECYIEPQEMVADSRHRLILELIKYSYNENDRVGLMAVTEAVVAYSNGDIEKQNKMLEQIGGVAYLSALQGALPNRINFDYYQRIVHNNYIVRTLKNRIQQKLLTVSADGEADKAINALRAELDELEELGKVKRSNDLVKVSDALKQHAEDIEEKALHAGEIDIYSIGKDMDNLTGGLHLEELTITAARPSVGKTAEMINESIRSLKSPNTANVVISAEMPTNQLLNRYAGAIGNIDLKVFKTGALDMDQWDRYHKAMGWLERQELYFDDTPGITIEAIERKVKKLQKELLKKGITKIVLFIDYLQLIESEKRFPNTTEKVSYISKTLKRMARRLKIAINALAQLNRGVEGRQEKRPMMSDLKDSGSIEQDADNIKFLHRDDYYDKSTEKKDIIEIIVAKQRNGPVGTVEMVFQKKFGKYLDLDRSHQGGDKK
ncbi:replicative DNA helicase [Paenibacillus camelliae]|uniref:replicative DNA helicase n=1 Tax=Paenibacillus camelliae TaxID=512410 RepID=UPI00203ACF6A|nr:DnaB-like helicase C-terminal domain-containing protein [Paenibacillus camelliae]MCM3632892.1 replicative DNA helicase [Paenibacillus camelliae]